MFYSTLIAAIMFGTPAQAQALPQLEQEAAQANPSLEALRAAEASLRANAAVAGSWSDPMLGIEYSNTPVDRWTLTAHPMSGLQLKIQQQLHFPGWSRLQREAGTHRADATGFAVQEATVQLQARVVRTWWTLAQTRALRTITEEHLSLTSELLEAAESRYRTGALGQHAVLRLQVLRDQLQDELGDFSRSEAQLTAALDRALSRETSSPYPTPTAIHALPVPTSDDWQSLAADARPLLKQIRASTAAAESSADFAKADVLPDLQVWAGYRLRLASASDPGTDFVSLGIGVPIPVASARKLRGTRDGWIANAAASRSNLAAAEDAIQAELTQIMASWERSYTKAQTYESALLPKARSTLEATQADFSVGRADFASLFDAEVTLLNLERSRVRAATDTHLQEAHATATLGTHPTSGATE